MCTGLRRLIFYKKHPDSDWENYGYSASSAMSGSGSGTNLQGFTYVLLCECYNLQESHLATACTIVDQLRARCCGYTALYVNAEL